MYKIIASLLFIFTTFAISAEDTYVFEAKGEFAKELKSLVEKYSKEGKIEAKVYKKESLTEDKSKTETSSLLSIFTDNSAEELKSADIEEGRLFYQKRCTNCHGVNAQKVAYNNSRVLTTLTPIQIVNALESYRSDFEYGNSTRVIMQEQTYSLSSKTIQSLAVYIYSLKHETKESLQKSSTQLQEDNEAPTSYLQ